MNKIKFAIIGDGFLAHTVTQAYVDGKMPDYELTGILGMRDDMLAELQERCGCPVFKALPELLDTKPEIICEMASVEAVQQYALDILGQGISLMALSIGAFADLDFFAKAKEVAKANNCKIHFSSGTIGAFDAMQTINLIGGAEASLELRRWAGSYSATDVYKPEIEETGVADTLFDGNATEAIKHLPKMINIGVATSLATTGPDNTYIRIIGDPDMPHNDDNVKICVKSDKVDMEFKVYSKNQIMTGWSVVSFLNNLASPVNFY